MSAWGSNRTRVAPCKPMECVHTCRDLAHAYATSCAKQQSQFTSIFFPAVLQEKKCLFSEACAEAALDHPTKLWLPLRLQTRIRSRRSIMELNSRYGPFFNAVRNPLGGSGAIIWPHITTPLQMPHCLTPMGQGMVASESSASSCHSFTRSPSRLQDIHTQQCHPLGSS